MKVTPYLVMVAADSDRRAQFVEFVARRASAGGDAECLLEICHFFGSGFSNMVRHTVSTDGGDYRYLEMRLFFDRYSVYDIGDTRHFLSRLLEAEDAEQCIEWLYDHDYIRRCDDCNEWEWCQHMSSTWAEDDNICRSCIENSYTYSEYYDAHVYSECARDALDRNGRTVTIHEDDDVFHYDDDEDMYVHNEYSPAVRLIGNYHSSKNFQRPQPSAWTRLKKRYMGVELEVEVPGGDRIGKVERLHKVINGEEFGAKAFFENDGSLSNGFEIITQPMGLDAHKEMWAWLKDPQSVRGLRSHNTSTCGLHVHISKENLTKLQIAKIVTFINDPGNESLIRAVARRYAEGYCKIKGKKIGTAHYSEDRYEAVNITPRKTIEFRIFKGSLKYESVMAAIQFANAVVEFCGLANVSIQELNEERFMEFIRNEYTEDTDFLVPYLEQRLETA